MKRILWLLNHDTLSKFELPLIKDLGFEIFTPKSALKEIFQSSGSITYEYDHTLTIPKDDLDLLNNYDFFSKMNMPLRIKKIINSHFEIAFTYTDTSFLILKQLIHNFEGKIFFRAFGVGPSNFTNYTDLIDYFLGESDKLKLKQLGSRFVFSQCYPNLWEIENDFLKNNSVYMPLGLPSEFYDIKDQWVGDLNKIMFFCTRINYIPESKKIYNSFKKDFKNFDYVIAGNQPEPVDDDKVLGFLEREELNEYYKKCKVMYYHSTHPRHLHYHPLEAMISGMPVVYMDGGLLSIIAKGKRQSGCCKSIAEARSKIQRIFEGDIKLINDIREDQEQILHSFSYEYNLQQWKENFLPMVVEGSTNGVKKGMSIAVFNADTISHFHKNDYIYLMNALSNGLKKVNISHSINYNVIANQYDLENEYKNLIENGVAVREYNFVSSSKKDIAGSLELMFKQELMWYGEYLFPSDHAQNYVESDYWLFLNEDKIDKPIAPIKPFGLYVESLGDRYHQEISANRISNFKNASFIITYSEQTKNDLIKHLGLREESIFIIPFLYSTPVLNNNLLLVEDHIVLELDASNPNFIKKIIQSINDYYSLYVGNYKVAININEYNEDEHGDLWNELVNIVHKSKYIKDKVTLHKELGVNEYNLLYSHSKKIIIPRYIKNIGFKLAKAMYFKKHIILNEYLFNRKYEEIGYTIEYKKFFEKENDLFNAISEPVKLIIYAIEAEGLTEPNANELSNFWEKIL
ncbi:hypothetical protein [Paenibacillus radicis (ex Gao et al. 2016)]|uniref:hypothetical protein n=1 Tax=Paenibacillus radicis (ex Gao et al. 2016) TaxID=1737354 RepID=UPI00166B9C02|nr:hypothetical protein [Paenibacillus radicis (ex Gao et al. 2016)]